MANSLDYQLMADNLEFKNRVRVLLVKVAYTIKNEADDTDYHAQREALANKIVRDVDNEVNRTVRNLVAQPGIYQNTHVVTESTLTADQATFGAETEVGELVYDGSKTASSWFDGLDQTIEEQIELIYNFLAGVNISVT